MSCGDGLDALLPPPGLEEAVEALAKMERRALRSWQVFSYSHAGHESITNFLTEAKAIEKEARLKATAKPGVRFERNNIPDKELEEQVVHLRTALAHVAAEKRVADGALAILVDIGEALALAGVEVSAVMQDYPGHVAALTAELAALKAIRSNP